MILLPIEIQIQFFKVHNHEISIEDFEQWLYLQKDLEEHLGSEVYFELISINFKGRHVKYEMGKVINPYLDFGKFEERRLKKVLRDLITKSEDFAKSLIETYDLYCSGYSFFEKLAMGYGLTFSDDFFDYADWLKLDPYQKENRINNIFKGVKKEAELVLSWIDSGKITLTGETNHLGHYSFIDKRNESNQKFKEGKTAEVANNKGKVKNLSLVEKIKGWFSQ